MISRLRKKFIFINMLLVSIVLFCVLGIFCYSNYSRLASESSAALSEALNAPEQADRPPMLEIGKHQKPSETNRIPTVVVKHHTDGSLSVLKERMMTITEEVLSDAVSEVLLSASPSGSLSFPSLRYEKKVTPDGSVLIAFADRSAELSTLRSLLISSVLIFTGAFAALFLISLFLSKWALAPAARTWEQQKQFIADASHELKTPLTVILANLNILTAHKTDRIADQLSWIENTQTEAVHMKKLVEDLLFLARSDAGKLPETVRQVDFSDLVLSCLLSFEPVAFEQGLSLIEDILPGLFLSGEESQLKQLIFILLDNACKYASSPGKIMISLRREQNRLLFSVSNSGQTIPEEDLPHIFERFYRADKSRSQQKGGCGLGLSIAQTIVTRHSGSIEAKSQKGETVFTVSLPAK